MPFISKLRKIIARNRIISYGFAFIILLILSAVISVKSVLLPIDLYVYKILHFNSEYVEGFDESILFVNINDKNNDRNLSKAELKLKTAELLHMIDSMVIYQNYQYEQNGEKYELPLIVVDASFDSNPAGHQELKNAIDSLYNNDIM
ncbi:MAG: hypothetical protein KJO00_00175, partial [Bacteroidia bacterium]|nr:hypothetical protein [Bacteroidia bacterium]